MRKYTFLCMYIAKSSNKLPTSNHTTSPLTILLAAISLARLAGIVVNLCDNQPAIIPSIIGRRQNSLVAPERIKVTHLGLLSRYPTITLAPCLRDQQARDLKGQPDYLPAAAAANIYVTVQSLVADRHALAHKRLVVSL